MQNLRSNNRIKAYAVRHKSMYWCWCDANKRGTLGTCAICNRGNDKRKLKGFPDIRKDIKEYGL